MIQDEKEAVNIYKPESLGSKNCCDIGIKFIPWIANSLSGGELKRVLISLSFKRDTRRVSQYHKCAGKIEQLLQKQSFICVCLHKCA